MTDTMMRFIKGTAGKAEILTWHPLTSVCMEKSLLKVSIVSKTSLNFLNWANQAVETGSKKKWLTSKTQVCLNLSLIFSPLAQNMSAFLPLSYCQQRKRKGKKTRTKLTHQWRTLIVMIHPQWLSLPSSGSRDTSSSSLLSSLPLTTHPCCVAKTN